MDGSVDPVRDAELINLEFAFSDLAQVEKRLERMKKDRKAGKANEAEGTALEKVKVVLEKDEPARNAILDEEEEEAITSFGSNAFVLKDKRRYGKLSTKGSLVGYFYQFYQLKFLISPWQC